MLVIKETKTFNLPINIDCAVAKGQFIGKAKVRTKPENKELFDRVENGEDVSDDAMIAELFEGFEGLPCPEGEEFKFITEGPASSYLVPACIQAYFGQYAEARMGNSKARRGR